MLRLTLLSIILIVQACSIQKTRKNVSTGDVTFYGGVFEEKSWKDELKFKRYSWFKEVSMDHDILISELSSSSPFADWMGRDRLHLSKCEKFYIAMVYSNINAEHGNSFLWSELEKGGFKTVSILNFSKNMKAHIGYQDWRLSNHKIQGLCLDKGPAKDLQVTIPGFKTKTLK